MTETGFFGTENIKKKILPLLMTAVITAAIMNVFLGNNYDILSFISAAASAALFAVYDFVAAHKKLGPLVYMMLGAVLLTVMSLVMSTVPRGYWFMEWFLTGGQTVENLPQFLFIVLAGFTFFISSVVYYFTHIIYRVSILTLVSLIPCAIYIKAAQPVPVGYAVLLAAVNIFVYVHQNRNKFASKHLTEGKAAEITSYIDFAAAAVLLAIIIPKPSVAPYYERFEEFTNRFNFGRTRDAMTGEYTSHSGNADNYNEMESRLLYLVSTLDPQYMKIESYDIYEPENRWWVYGEGADKGYKNWETRQGNMNFSTLLKAYEAAGTEILDGVPRESLTRLSAYEDNLKTSIVRAVDFPSSFAISPQRTTNVNFYLTPELFTYRSPAGELWPSTHSLKENDGYTLVYFDSEYARGSGWINSGLCDMTYDDFGYYLYRIYNESEEEEFRNTADAFLYEWRNAEKYAPENYAPVSDELRRISDNITAGLEYDYEKAEALERFFTGGRFTYDLGYKAPEENDTPEFFINESRRGTCSDFATAYCLLARAAGLRVRYNEGFGKGTPASEDQPALFQLYTEDAHAYPEVYIPGAGWVIYEPTVSGSSDGRGADGGDGAAGVDYLTVAVTVAALIIIILPMVLLVIFMPAISEKIFAFRIKRMSAEKGIILAYGRFSGQCGRLFGIPAANMTVGQLSDFIAGKTGDTPFVMTDAFERVCYGIGAADKSESAAAYDCGRAFIKRLKKIRKAEKRMKKK